MMTRNRDGLVIGRIVGDVVDPFTRSVSLRVIYNNNVEVINGCALEPSQVVNPPRFYVGQDDPTVLFTLVMVDPDAPTPSDPNEREYLHWLVTDIPAASEATLGQEIVAYESPRPMLGIHRFVFILLKQANGIRQRVYPPGWRQNFNTRDFSEIYNLGLPVSAIFFNSQRGSVPSTRRR